jgi:hypothetical protein
MRKKPVEICHRFDKEELDSIRSIVVLLTPAKGKSRYFHKVFDKPIMEDSVTFKIRITSD